MFLVTEFDVGAWKDGAKALGRALNTEVGAAVNATARAMRDEAKNSHSYQDRTGRLTESIHTEPRTGTFLGGDLEGTVIANTHYAGYVEEGTERMRAYEYLGTAAELRGDEFRERVEDALEAAIDRAEL